MARTNRPKTILEYFESGKEIDAAVKRAVRKAVAETSRSRRSAPRAQQPKRKRAA
jgi:hypothetical protein